jgi:2-haloacid dehalogenase/putative hydrolase of the HAD superfamily
MLRSYDIVTFDCYGTLIDWESGIAEAFARAAREDGVVLRSEDVLRTYASTEPLVQRERYRPYREVLAETALRVAHSLGWRRADPSFLATSLPSWRPFPDTNGALQRLRDAGFLLGILSNVDDDLLTATRRHFSVSFDLVVTAQQVRRYKPAPDHFETAKKWIADRRWLHAAQSNFHDVAPATALGIATAWVNRHGEAGGVRPTMEVRNLDELANALTSEP